MRREGVMTMQEERSHRWIYITIVVVIVALMVAGVALHREQKLTAEAKAKAAEFVAALQAEGLPAPSVDAAARMFGTDGGPYVQNLEDELMQAQYVSQLGTAGAASRPVILDEDFVKAADAFVRVYAPDKASVSEFREWLHRLETGETTD
jgi:hypothetical protein